MIVSSTPCHIITEDKSPVAVCADGKDLRSPFGLILLIDFLKAV